MTRVASVMKLESRVLEIKGKVRDARRLHSITCHHPSSRKNTKSMKLRYVSIITLGYVFVKPHWSQSRPHCTPSMTYDKRAAPVYNQQITIGSYDAAGPDRFKVGCPLPPMSSAQVIVSHSAEIQSRICTVYYIIYYNVKIPTKLTHGSLVKHCKLAPPYCVSADVSYSNLAHIGA